ncbi:MAG: cation:proton antiporter [Nanoarchaeota archaeon]|nr:cation:proton antiporter [Nanoarchaeota archaeon]
MEIFTQIGIMFIISAAGAFIAKLIKQPIIPAYIIAGAIVGPVLGFITSSEIIRTMSEIGIAFLLFVVGLEMSVKKLKDTGFFATIGGTMQMIFIFIIGFWIAILLGFLRIEAVYVGFIVAFSSTMVVVKLLSDRREIDTLHGRIIIGILLMQDIIALFVLSILASPDGFALTAILISLAKGAGLLLIAWVLSNYTFPPIFKFAAKSQELLFLVSLGVCFLFSIALSLIGFSIIIGAFIAGLSLANLPYNIEIIGRVKSLKDFFATMFFVSLGLELLVPDMRSLIIPLIVLSLIVLIIKPFVLLVLCAIARYTKRNSFMTSISLAQISEFSLIIVAQGLMLGHISQDLFSLTLLLAIITITATSYIMSFELKIFNFLSKYLTPFDIATTTEHLQYLPEELEYDFILIGYDRIGYNIFKMLDEAKKTFLVIDFNPDIVKKLASKKIPCIYGDIGDPEILERLNLKKTEFVVSTVPGVEDNIHILKKVKAEKKNIHVFVTATIIDDALKLYKEGADYVILPHFLGGERVSNLINEVSGDSKKINLTKLAHIHDLKERIDMEHEHPRGV